MANVTPGTTGRDNYEMPARKLHSEPNPSTCAGRNCFGTVDVYHTVATAEARDHPSLNNGEDIRTSEGREYGHEFATVKACRAKIPEARAWMASPSSRNPRDCPRADRRVRNHGRSAARNALVARRLRPGGGVCRGSGALPPAARRTHGRRAQGGVREPGGVAEAEARHGGVGVDVRRHGAAGEGRRLRRGAVYVRAEARTGDRLQAEGAGRRRPGRPGRGAERGRVAVARLRDRRQPVSRLAVPAARSGRRVRLPRRPGAGQADARSPART